ncbi:hypothetical protein OG384_04535 [Streptomyces sp. NBC_01324]|uniref:hypothetical protein n=1 Tax=Streptomyces sp. NBC_01324 TaxID=2903826 RepID=UPI002E137642|nr:hypothetical protein OG384_04535 [Streptomyces sp. NBC_01324]
MSDTTPSRPAMTMREIRDRLGHARPDTTPTTPAVWSEGDPLMEAMAAAVYEQCASHPEQPLTVDDPRTIAAVAATVARLVLGTTDQQPETAPAPLSEVWTVWHEDESVWAHFATVDAARQGTIDCWQEDEPSCPDYSWLQEGPRLELIVGGEHSGVYASRYRVYGTPEAVHVDRANEVYRLALSEALGLGTGAPWDAIRDRAAELHRAAAQPTESGGPCPHCRHISCRHRTPCNAILSATSITVQRCPCTGQPAADQPDTETEAAKCTYCGGNGVDPDDEGDYVEFVHMHDPGSRGPCSKCHGAGRTTP